MDTENRSHTGMAPTLLLGALLVGWSIDFLFWGKSAGISFPLFTSLALAVGVYVARRAGVRPAFPSLALAALAPLLAGLTAYRAEPFTRALNGLAALGSLALLAHTWAGGQWPRFGFADYLRGSALLAASALARPVRLISSAFDRWAPAGIDRRLLRNLFPWLRGLGLAFPAVVFFALLLSSADPIFSQLLSDALAYFRLENLAEYLFRLAYILIFAYLFSGVYDHGLRRSGEARLIVEGRPWIPPFLGMPEASLVLGCVDLLFAAFVGVQFRYFFGGRVNISAQGFTYAEYARQGFFELVAVSAFSLLLLFSLNSLTRRQTARQRRAFSFLSAGLVGTNLIILVSAFQRLLLYEDAFGFTRLRTYTHVFIIWLGVVLSFMLLLDLLNRTRRAALVILLSGLGFTLSLTLLNVDGFIVRQNVARARGGAPLDASYLVTLSLDAAPALAQAADLAARDPASPAGLAPEVRRAFACHAIRHEGYDPGLPWQSIHLARLAARRTWMNAESLFKAGEGCPE